MKCPRCGYEDHTWTEREILILRRFYGQCGIEDVSEKLGFRRSPHAIHVKASKLHITRRCTRIEAERFSEYEDDVSLWFGQVASRVEREEEEGVKAK